MATELDDVSGTIDTVRVRRKAYRRIRTMNVELPKYRDKAVLEEQYIREGKSAEQIAEEFDCSNATVVKWLRRYGLYAKYRPSERVETRLRGKPEEYDAILD